MTFENHIVLITGGSRGIGKATAIEFANRGGVVIILYRTNTVAANSTLKSLKGTGHQIIQCDICDLEAVKTTIPAIVRKHGRIDVLINNAGISIEHNIDELSIDQWDQAWRETFETNVFGTSNLSFIVAKAMIKNGGGSIVNVSSRGAFRGEPTKPGYGASKAALNAMTQSMAKALGQYNISVSAVAPGFTATDMGKSSLTERELEAIKRDCPLKRIATPEEVAYSIAFLASKRAAYSTGAILDINGASYLRT